MKLRDDATNRYYSNYVYDSILINATNQIFSSLESTSINERTMLEQITRYFRVVMERKSQENTIDEMVHLRFDIIGDFQLIEDYVTMQVFLEIDSARIGQKIQSVWVFGRKYGAGTGDITVNIRKASDDTVAATIGSFDIQHFPQNTETELTIRNRFNNTYNMVANDSVSVEFPSNATNGFEMTTHSTAGNPTNTTCRSFDYLLFVT